MRTSPEGWLHTIMPGHVAPLPLPSIVRSARLADIEIRDRVYRTLLDDQPLLERHALELARRGLNPATILRLGYKSWGSSPYQRRPDAENVLRLCREAIDVPGIILRESARGQQYATLSGSTGIGIPLRNVKSQIQGLQIMADDRSHGKYQFLSSASRGGSSPGTPIHVARPSIYAILDPTPGPIWLTEGALKADIAADRLQRTVLAIPGVSCLKHLEETLAELQENDELTHGLVVALDMDYLQNASVRKARNLIAERAARMGIPVWLADWVVELKGLDDLLVAGGRPKLTPYQVQGNGPRPVVEDTACPAIQKTEPCVSLEQARLSISRAIDSYLNRDRKIEGDVGLILNGSPGQGKSTAITFALNKAIKKKRRRRIAVIVARHEQAKEEPGREEWGEVRGRTHLLQDLPTPCMYPEKLKRVMELRVVGQSACNVCPSQELCKSNPIRQDTTEPFYLNQFESDPEKRITVYQAAHFLTPNAWRSASTIVIDDLDLDNLQLETVTLKRTELEETLAWIERHPQQESYALAQPLIHLFSELTRSAPVGEFHLSGQPLIDALQLLAAEHQGQLVDLLEQATKAREPEPFPEGPNCLNLARLDIPRRFVADLVSILSHELRQSLTEREVVGWNRRLAISRTEGEDVVLTLSLRRELPSEALVGKDLIIVNGSLSVEEASRRFPHIKRWIVVAPKVEIPSSVQVIQFVDRAWGKRSLYDPAVQEQALAIIGAHIKDHANEKIALLTYKFFGQIAKKRYPELQVGHFYSQRGSNKFKDCDVEIVFGTPRPNPMGFLQVAETLHWDGIPLNLQTVLRIRRIDNQLVKVREYLDPRLLELSRSKTEQEMVQAVLRIRPLLVKAPRTKIQGVFDFAEALELAQAQQRKKATVYIHSNQPLPDLKVEARRSASAPPIPRPDLVEPKTDYFKASQQLLDQGKSPTEVLLSELVAPPDKPPSRHQVRRWKSGIDPPRGSPLTAANLSK